MDYCKSHFGKSINELTIKDVTSFFKKDRVESDQIEFKSINSIGNVNEKFVGINKSVCAFLNSSGGLLIWGAPIGKKVEGKKEKIYKGALTFFNESLEKDFVVSKISDSIIPLPSNIRVKILKKKSSSIAIIEIDSSEYSPHQTADTYYMRIDGQSKPAPHHYIEALFKKIKYPFIEAFLKITKAEIYQSRYKLDIEIFFFNWSPLQNEEQLSFRMISENGKFGRSQYPEFNNLYRLEGHEYYKDNVKEIFYYGEPIREAEVLLFDPHELSNAQNKAYFIITFGGKYSPRKNCDYVFDFNKILTKNPNDIIIERKENKLVKDIHDEKGVNRTIIIEKILKKRDSTS